MNSRHFVLHIYCGKFFRRIVLPDELEFELPVHFYPEQTGEEAPVTLRLEALNGIWSIVPGDFSVKKDAVESDGTIESGNYLLYHKYLHMELDMRVFYTRGFVFSTKYTATAEVSFFFDANGVLEIEPAGKNRKPAAVIETVGKESILTVNEGCCAYVNGAAAERALLRHGDQILIYDVMLVYLGGLFALNAVDERKVTCRLPLPGDEPGGGISGGDREPADRESYFQPAPRVFYKLAEDTITIDAPPAKHEAKTTPAIFSLGASGAMFFVMLFSIWMRSQYTSNQMMMAVSLVMILGSAVGTIVFPMLLRRYQARKEEQSERTRVRKYQAYIESLDRYLLRKHAENRKWLSERYLSVEKAYKIATFDGYTLRDNTMLWNKSPEFQDFLDIRIGVGARKSTIEIEMPREGFSLVNDPLKKLAQLLHNKFRYIIHVPVSVSLYRNYIVGVIGTRSVNRFFIQSAILQICANFSYRDVKTCFVYDPSESGVWGFVRWLPHTWTTDRVRRLVATSKEGVADLFNLLEKVREDRREKLGPSRPKGKKGFIHSNDDEVIVPHYVVFVLSRALMTTSLIGLSMLDEDEYYGISFVYLEDTINFLPKKADIVIQNTSRESSVFTNSDESNKMRMFVADTTKGLDLSKMARILFPTRIMKISENTAFPDGLTFLGMYKAACIEDLNVGRRWAVNRSTHRIEAPVGVGADGKVFSLNVHERHHGPHGLMAGMTGSGKSEFIQSFILSLAMNYNPNEIAFILIDYKGGGMAGQFADLPHLAGIVTNLEGNEIARSLNTLSSELTRRQNVFKNLGINNIDKYHEKFGNGEVTAPMPHLLIIADEFAELKKNQPEFMQALVSAARIGRSLGVHLILATQHPSGVVDDDIWSNSNFRVCLRVLDRVHSNDMLKRPDAAGITEPGRAYVQVGNNEIFELIQSGYSGAPYIPRDKMDDEGQKSIYLLDEGGRPVQSARLPEAVDKSTPTQLAAIVRYLKELAEKEQYSASTLWKPTLSNLIYWDDIAAKQLPGTGRRHLAPVVGLLDDTLHQEQPLMEAPLSEKGHIAVYGLPGSGKTVFIQTLITALGRMYTPLEVNIYILDFATRSLRYFLEMPHVGDVVFEEEEAKVNKFFAVMEQTLQNRKRLFGQMHISNYAGYAGKDPLPAIVVVLHDFIAFRDAYPDLFDPLCRLVANGVLYGIYFVITAKGYGSVPTKIMGNITTTFAFQLKDKYDYANAFAQSSVMIPKAIPGRGVLKRGNIMEFQIALAARLTGDTDRIDVLTAEFKAAATQWEDVYVPPVPSIPEPYVCESELRSHAYKHATQNGRIPLGYDFSEVSLVSLPFEQMDIFPVVGFAKSGKTNFLQCMMLIAESLGYEIFIFDNHSFTHKPRNLSPHLFYGQSEKDYHGLVLRLEAVAAERIRDRLAYLKQNGAQRLGEYMGGLAGILVVIDDFQDFIETVSNEDLDIFHQTLDKLKKAKISLIASLNPELLPAVVKNASPSYAAIFKSRDGLLLGGGYEKLGNLFMNFRFDRKLQTAGYPPGKGLLFLDQRVRVVITPSIW